MANKTTTHFVRGVAHWAKVIGAPRLNTFSDEKEWTIDVSVDADGMKLFKQLGILDRLKDPKEGDERGRFITFKQREYRTVDGERIKNEPIRVVDANNEPWGNRLIGNGSIVEVKFVVADFGVGKKKGVYIRAIRVLDLVPYEVQDFAPLSSDDEYFAGGSSDEEAAAPSKELPGQTVLEELDDDIPID